MSSISPLEALHPMPEFDGRLTFNEAAHTYTDASGRKFTGTTDFISRFMSGFDAPLVIARMRASNSVKLRTTYAGMTDAQIAAAWEAKRDSAANLGTGLHALIEQVLDGRDSLDSVACVAAMGNVEYEQFILWHREWLQPRGWLVWRVELRVCSQRYGLAGSIDALFINPATGHFVIVDWKRTPDLGEGKRFGKGPPRTCLPPISHLPDNKFVKYALQQNLYRWMLETGHVNNAPPGPPDGTPRRVEGMFLVLMHPDKPDFCVRELPRWDAEVLAMVETLDYDSIGEPGAEPPVPAAKRPKTEDNQAVTAEIPN